MKIFILVALLISAAVRAQIPSFDTQTNILTLPTLQVGSETFYADVQLALPPAGAWSLLSLGAGSAPTNIEFAVQPTELTGATNQQQLVFVVVGGVPPYQAVSTNPGIFTIASLSHTTGLARASGVLQLTGAAGTASAVVTDAAGGILVIPASIAAPATEPVLAASLAASPASIAGGYGDAITLIVAGGTPPYNVEPSNRAVIMKLSQEENPLAVSATIKLYITGMTGSCFINVADAAGNLISVPVSVQ